MISHALEIILAIAGVFGFIATIVGAVMIIRSTAVKVNADAQKDLVATLMADKEVKDSQILELQGRQLESTKSIAMLQGKVDVLQTIPLKDISTNMGAMAADMSAMAKHQHDILALISGSGKSNGS